MSSRSPDAEPPERSDPYELLILAAMFFVPGTLLLFQIGPMIAFHSMFRSPGTSGGSLLEIEPEEVARGLGALLLLFGLALVGFYFHLRRVIKNDVERERRRRRRKKDELANE